MHCQALIEQYLETCRRRGLSPKSISNYQWALRRLPASLPRSSDDLVNLLAEPLSRESKRTIIVNVCTFLKWVSRNHPAYTSPLPDRLPGRKVIPRLFSRSELATILSVCGGQRDRTLILLPLDNGLRVGEIASIRRPSIVNGHIRVLGKGGGDRQVPLSQRAEKLLDGLGDGEHLWTGRWGPIGLYGIISAYRRIFARSLLTGRKLGPHTLRHTFGTEYMRSGGNVRILQNIMGQSKLETTMIYVHLSGTDVKRDHDEHTPLASLQL